MAYRIEAIPMTLSDLQGCLLLQAFCSVIVIFIIFVPLRSS